MHLKRTGIVQGKHADKALSVDLLLLIAHKHLKRLYRGQGINILDLPEGPDTNIKMMHPQTSYCTNVAFCVIMVPIPMKHTCHIITGIFGISIRRIYDIHKKKLQNLVKLTMKFGFYTLGCKVNQYETQAMEQLLTALGHVVGDFSQPCDGYIINTCSVTAVADKKNRAVIRRCRRDNPKAVIGVCGCYSQHDPEAVEQLDVDVIGGSAGREAFVQQMLSCMETRTRGKILDEALKRRDFEVLPAGGLEGRTRAMLKVQDGCCNFCTYCIIPYTRGPIRSATLSWAVDQAKKLQAQGYRELVLTGIEIASWGKDLPGKPELTVLVEAICQAVPEMRVRLGSLEPRIVTEDFCARLKQLANLCPQFHLSMQSGCDTVLQRMKRKYDTARYLESVRLLKTYFPDCAVTTDMIVAFPGETEAEFQQSLSFIRTCGFADMHIFPYSRRPGTPADQMPGQHGNAVKEARSREAVAVAEKMSVAYREALVGTELEVLFEEPEGEFFTGHAPNYVKVYVRGENLHNQLRNVQVTQVFRDGVMGTFEKKQK